MKEDVIHYQQLMLNSWPAKNNILYKGWIVRVSEGVTRRANSVLPLSYFGDNLGEDIEAVEKLYSKNDLDSIFQLSDYYRPEKLEEMLLSVGYEKIDETVVMDLDLSDFHYDSSNADIEIVLEEKKSDLWLEILSTMGNYSDERRRGVYEIINRIQQRKIHLIAYKKTQSVGLVLGIVERDIISIYNLLVNTQFRRMSIGRTLMLEAIKWSVENNIRKMYLSVEADNFGAKRLYEKLSFKEVFRYRYLVKSKNGPS